MNKKKVLAFTGILGAILIAFFGGFFYGAKKGWELNLPSPFENIIQKEKPQSLPSADMSIFWETWEKVLEKYVDREKLDPQKNIEGATKGLVWSLDDPYSEFLNQEETKDLEQDLTGEFTGIGVEISKRNGVITIVSPLPNSPAEKSGLKSGDQIIKINDQDALEMSLTEATKIIRGEEGTKVNLTIYRPSTSATLNLEIKRAKVVVPSFSYKILDDNIAYLKIYNFNQPLILEFYLNSFDLINKNPKGLIIDLRNNPGGYLDIVVEIAGWFLDKNDIILKEDLGNNEIKLHKNDSDGAFKNIPTVVLINEGTASASEILAGALRDNRNVQLIGTKSFGKGSVQEVVSLSGGNSLKITVARWLTPNGTLIEGNGLKPDIEIKNQNGEQTGTYEEINVEKDAQLFKSLEVLKEIINNSK